MGSHVWAEQCPCCGFEEMIVSSDGHMYIEVACQICGYRRWTEERVPNAHDIKKAKRILSKMDDKEKLKAKELYCNNNTPLIDRLRGNYERKSKDVRLPAES